VGSDVTERLAAAGVTITGWSRLAARQRVAVD
jgi:phosphoglycerate dehydrogenase-like enzyme